MEENLREILFGGQTFSWREENGVFSAPLNGRVYRIRSIEDAKGDEYLSNYFDLNTDYEAIREAIRSKDDILKRAVDEVGPLRLLNQDSFTVLISFILSQNNNIKRITGLCSRISERYGKRIEDGYYLFPEREELYGATEDELRALGVGFRAPFIVDAVKKADILSSIPSLSYDDALSLLMSIKGVGPKVASCILIFGFHRMEAFPIDVWMKRVLDEYYPGKDTSYFLPYAALSQQYLFSWIRLKSKKLIKN